ncbi:MAG: hypothetical protein J6K42_05105 [Clostridia bacterium]|nr:hypothetical protein [Clostridia bacterium]
MKKNRKYVVRRAVAFCATLAVVGAGVMGLVACKDAETDENPTITTTTATVTAMTATTTTTEVTTTVVTTTTINVVEVLPDSAYTKAEVITDSVIVRDNNKNQFDWLERGQVVYLTGAKYGDMQEAYYTKAGGVLLHGWIPNNSSWVKIHGAV